MNWDETFSAVVVFGVCVAAWDVARRYFLHVAVVRDKGIKEAADQIKLVTDLKESLILMVERYDSSVDTYRTITRGFLESMTAIVKLNEEEKKHLINRVAASKLEKRR